MFEEYIYNTFVHFARVCGENGKIVYPVLFQKKRLCYNDQIDVEMNLMENYYAKFRMLGKGRVIHGEDTITGPDKDLVENIWSSKVEFILALKDFYKNNILPVKREVRPPKIEALVSRKKNEFENHNKPRTKIKDFIEINQELRKFNDHVPEKKATKFKMYVTKTFLKSSFEKPKKKLGPIFSKATRKIMAIKNLLKIHETDPLRIRRFSLKTGSVTEKLMFNISSNFNSTAGFRDFRGNLNSSKDLCQQLQKVKHNPFNKKSIVESYLRFKYVSIEKIF